MNICNRVAFSIFGIDVYFYGLIIAGAIIACVVLSLIFCKHKNIDTNMPFEIFLAIIPLGILTARLFSVIFEPGLSLADFFNFRTGGMSIFGAVLGGALGVLVYKLIRKKPFLQVADIITSVLLIGQSIGRWGNYFNEELYGMQIDNPAWQFFPFAVQIDGNWFAALFFYESVLTFIGFVVIMIVYLKTNKTGLVTGIYLVYYGTIRLVLENMRQPEFILKWGNLQVSSLVSALFVACGVAILIYIIVKNYKQKKEQKIGRQENS